MNRKFFNQDMAVGRTDDGQYYVEEILGAKFVRGNQFYLVKWKYWPSSFNSWEPLAHLGGSKEAIEEYLEKVKAQRLKRKTASATRPRVSIPSEKRKRSVSRTPKVSSRTRVRPLPPVESSESSGSDDDAEEVFQQVLKNIPVSNVVPTQKKIEKIHGLTYKFGDPAFVIKWEGQLCMDVIYAASFSKAFPQETFEFCRVSAARNMTMASTSN